MLAVKHRLSSGYYIDRAKEKGKLYQFDNFGICVYERPEKDKDKPTRFAFVVSTKVSSQAVDRNRVKRVLNETIRYETKHLVTGYDVVFLTKKGITTMPTDVVMKQTKDALKKIGIIT